MAYGIHCKCCGWYESIHYDSSCLSDEEFETKRSGYKKSLQDCRSGGFVPEDPKAEAQAYARDTEGTYCQGYRPSSSERINRNIKRFSIKFPPPMERVGMDDNEMILSLLGRLRPHRFR